MKSEFSTAIEITLKIFNRGDSSTALRMTKDEMTRLLIYTYLSKKRATTAHIAIIAVKPSVTLCNTICVTVCLSI